MNHTINPDLAYLILARLREGGHEPRSTGFQCWVSRCPVHLGDASSLSVTLNHDTTFSVRCHCHDPSGRTCSTAEIARAVGVSLGGAFPRDAWPARPYSAVPGRENGSTMDATRKAEPPPEVPLHEPGPHSVGRAVSAAEDTASRGSPVTNGESGEVLNRRATETSARNSTPETPASQAADEGPRSATTAGCDQLHGREPGPFPTGEIVSGTSVLPGNSPVHDGEAATTDPVQDGDTAATDPVQDGDTAATDPGWDDEVRGPRAPTTGVGLDLGLGVETAVERLCRLASSARLVRGSDGRFFASIPIGDRLECHPLRSVRFARWLSRAYRGERNASPTAEALKEAVRWLEDEADEQNPLEAAPLRVGRAGAGAGLGSAPNPLYYLDLGDHTLRAIAIGPGGWELVDRPPVSFRRPDGFAALPIPSRNGSVQLLRKFANVTDAEFPLLIAWLTAAVLPVGPYPVLNLIGEQGSAKSTLARVARLLIDPHASPLRSEPESRRDLMVSALNNWLLPFDNISVIPGWFSDGLCRLSTGGSFAARKFYDERQEHHWSARRPVIINGIGELARKGDLVDRSLFLNMPLIPDTQRQYEEELWASFDADAPRLLGGLLDAVVGGLRRLPAIQLAARPRMADFARWGEAVCQSLGYPPNTFLTAYLDNRHLACQAALDDSPVARAVLTLSSQFPKWTGTATELFELLRQNVREPLTNVRRWPQSPRWLCDQLRRDAPQLRTSGVTVTFERNRQSRLIRIESFGPPGRVAGNPPAGPPG